MDKDQEEKNTSLPKERDVFFATNQTGSGMSMGFQYFLDITKIKFEQNR